MTKTTNILAGSLMSAIFALTWIGGNLLDSKKEIDILRQHAQKEADKIAKDERLGQYVINLMFKSKKTVETLSPAHMQALAQEIVRVADDIFDKEEEKQAFIGALQIESQFLRFSQSPTGPKGLAQLTRNTFHSALKNCGVEQVNDDDVWDVTLNLAAGACYFKEQLVREHGNIVSAIVDYNQGPESDDAKMFRKGGDLKSLEPAKYVSKLTYNARTTTDQKMPGVPAISDLPKPTPPTMLGPVQTKSAAKAKKTTK